MNEVIRVEDIVTDAELVTESDSNTDSDDEISIESIHETMVNVYYGIEKKKDFSEDYIKEIGHFMNLYQNKNDNLYQNSKGIMFQYGIYYRQNIYEAIECYKKICDYDIFAMNTLGDIYYEFFEEHTKAIYYYTLSADIGNIEGMFGLAIIYKNSEEFKDITKAIYWYTRIIQFDKENVRALRTLYYIYKDQKNYTDSLECLTMIQNIKHECTCNRICINKKNIQRDINELNELIKNQKKLVDVYSDIQTDSCAICLNGLKGTLSPILILVCGHSFHYNCTECIKGTKACPVCRESF